MKNLMRRVKKRAWKFQKNKKERYPFHLTREEAEKRRSGGDLENIFFSGRCRLVHKWDDYFQVYEKYFAPYRGTDVTIIEIGVSQGGSLDMWREYFGATATIYGLDIDSDCAKRVTAPNQVRIGSQADPTFLDAIVEESGPPDIVLDDGSHFGHHQIASFRSLWPALKDGGVYVIEDTHTSYWPGHHGGYGRRDTAIGLAKILLDDMHGAYHDQKLHYVQDDEVLGVHIYERMIVIEKQRKKSPGHIKIEQSAEG